MRDMVQVRRSGDSYRREPDIKIQRSQFNRSHGVKTTFDASVLVPILVDEVLPGDTFTCKLNGLIRILSPLEAPIMDNIEVETHYFFVPARLVWDNWEKFMGAQDNPGDSIDYTIPVLSSGSCDEGEIFDYMGVPLGTDFTQNPINVLPIRAYRLIWNEWYRSQDLQDSLVVDTSDGPDTTSGISSLKKRGKKHDYFTTCLPFLQKGDEVTLPLTNAPILGIAATDQAPSLTPGTVYETSTGATTFAQAYASTEMVFEATAPSGATPAIYADLSASGVSINALRESVAIQRLLERDARGGTRYVELLHSHFGVVSPDFRLQRPEYLGGGKSFINVSAVANQSATATENQGELRGVGQGVISGHGFAKSFTEHGYVLGLMSARGDLTYQKGLDRMWARSTRYDFYVPALQNLGEQAVLNKEIYVSNNANDDLVFGYQERWAEYRYKPSILTGLMRSDATGSLDFWHLSEDFGTLPTLGSTFIQDATPMARVTTVPTEPDFILDAWFDYRCARPLPVYSVPSLMGRL